MNDRWARWVTKYRGRLVGGLLLLVGLCTVGDVSMDVVLWPAGLGVLAVGAAIRIWSRQHIRDTLGRPVGLARTGPYAVVRHPLYVGNTLLFVGTAVLSELPWAPPVVLVGCGLIYSITAKWEETRCLQKYGAAYREYMEAVPRWWPRLSVGSAQGLLTPRSGLAVRAEWPCLLLVLLFVLRDLLVPTL